MVKRTKDQGTADIMKNIRDASPQSTKTPAEPAKRKPVVTNASLMDSRENAEKRANAALKAEKNKIDPAKAAIQRRIDARKAASKPRTPEPEKPEHTPGYKRR